MTKNLAMINISISTLGNANYRIQGKEWFADVRIKWTSEQGWEGNILQSHGTVPELDQLIALIVEGF